MQYKTVSLFKVTAEFVDVPVDQKALEEFRKLNPAPFISMNLHAPEHQAVCEVARMEILHYINQPGCVWPFLRLPELRTRNELAIAVEPELARLIRLPLADQLKRTENTLTEFSEGWRKADAQYAQLLYDVESWWAKPWYVRVWRALRG